MYSIWQREATTWHSKEYTAKCNTLQYSVGNWFVALPWKTIHVLCQRLWGRKYVRVTNKIHDQ